MDTSPGRWTTYLLLAQGSWPCYLADCAFDLSGLRVKFATVASPSMPAEDFRIAGLTNPSVVVPADSKVQVELVNADPDMAHGFVVATQGAEYSATPMLTARPSFPGSGLWFLGEPTAAGMHAGTLSFTASTAGAYTYFCPVPGHAQKGMAGTFVVGPPS
jgi:rusticyanin